jgi:hypothetical protein
MTGQCHCIANPKSARVACLAAAQSAITGFWHKIARLIGRRFSRFGTRLHRSVAALIQFLFTQ